MDDYEAFCATAYPRLVAALTHHFADRWLAEELAQESLIRAGVRWGRVGTLDSPIGWAYRVACNLGISELRHRRAEQRALRRRPPDALVHEDPETPDLDGLRRGLEALTEDQRRTVIARYYLGLTTEETAAALGTTVGNVRVLSHRAIQRLRAQVDVADPEETVRVR